jgi:hypothetical protein
MSKHRETKLSLEKVLNPERVKINLLLSSLYLSAFEILKISIIEGTKDVFVYAQEITDEQVQELKTTLGEDTVLRMQEQFVSQVEEYEKEVGTKFDTRDQQGLILSCRWLQRMSALDENEVDEIKQIRDHRNKIAHELPHLLVSEGIEVDVNLLQRIRELLRKIDTFWARSDLLFDLETLDEVKLDDVHDDNIFSGRVILLDMILKTVAEYWGEQAA